MERPSAVPTDVVAAQGASTTLKLRFAVGSFDWLFLPSRPPGTWLRCSAGGVLLGLGLRVAAAPPMPRQDLVWLGDVLKHRKSATLPVELQGPEGARHATLRFNSIGICD